MDIAQYNFDYKNITGNNKKVVIAVPVAPIPFQGKNFVACFIGIGMNSMLKNISLQRNNDSTTFL